MPDGVGKGAGAAESVGAARASAPGVIRLAPSLVADLLAHARREQPRECCGVLLSSADAAGAGDAAVPLVYHPGRNVAAAPDRYELAAEDLLRAFLLSEEEGLRVWGFFHSHVSSEAYPSTLDVSAAYYPNAVYAILSLNPDAFPGKGIHLSGDGIGLTGQGSLRFFRIRDGRVDEQQIRLSSPHF